jgi:hypothetical protein
MVWQRYDGSDTSSSLRISINDSFAESGLTLHCGVTATGKAASNPDMASSLKLTADHA